MFFEKIDSYIKDAQAAAPRAIELRRQIHMHPELGNQEEKTSELIVSVLTELGIEVSRPVGTSVVGLLRGGKPGKTVALRADMDALPIQEDTPLPYKSTLPGKMHACGHDMHTAGLLGTAMVLARRREELSGNVKFLFQPDEEDRGGAQRMIEAGCMENPAVDAVFGAHVDPTLPTGHVGFKYGKSYAAADIFTVTIHGAGCHGATPHVGIDVISVGAQVISALQQIVSRRISPLDSAVVTVGAFHAGTAGNIIAQEATMKGILRTLGPERRLSMRKLFTETVEGVCAAMGARAEVNIHESYPGVVNHDGMVDFVRSIAEDALGRENIHIFDSPTMGTEDFGFYLEKAPGVFYNVGVGNPEIGAIHPLHSPHFIADDDAMAHMIAMHAAAAAAYLQ